MTYYHQRRVGTVAGTSFGPTNIDSTYTYSWRSKKPTGAFVPSSAIQNIDPKRDGLLEALRKRKEQYENIDQDVSGVDEGQPRNYRYDNGHSFTTVRHRMGIVSWDWTSSSSSGHFEVSPGLALVPAFFNLPKSGLGYTTRWEDKEVFPSSLPQGSINKSIGAMIPKNAGIGETIIEIVRGDIPGILTSVRRLSQVVASNPGRFVKLSKTDNPTEFKMISKHFLKSGKRVPSWLRATGQDYLELQFGMLPLITSVMDALAVLLKTTESLYGESFRRKNRTPVLTFTDSINQGGGIGSSPGLIPYRGSSTGLARGPFHNHQVEAKLDMDVSLRATIAGRPTAGLLKHYDKAQGIIEGLGLWYPSLAWDLLPYSWLADWAFHIGRSIEASAFLSKSGAYPIDYAYATFRSEVKQTIAIDMARLQQPQDGWRFRSNNPVSTASTIGLYRTRVNPFGFALPINDLTSSQYAILVALGLAKSR